MQRKVIQIANSTQLISLPRKWTLQHNIKKGDSLDIIEKQNELLISTVKSEKKEKKLELNIPSPKNFLRRMLFSPYIQGYTEIRINFEDYKVFELITDEVQYLMGFEIVTQSSKYCIIKSVATAIEQDFDNILNRIFYSTTNMFEEIINLMKINNHKSAENLISIELTNNKLTYFCLRILNTKGYRDDNKRNSLYYTILEIEEIVDNLRDICNVLVRNNITFDKEIISLAEKCLDFFNQVYCLFKKFDHTLLFNFNMGIRKFQKEIFNNVDKEANYVEILSYLNNILSKISHISKEIHY
jgi:phosphate uptake regulator